MGFTLTFGSYFRYWSSPRPKETNITIVLSTNWILGIKTKNKFREGRLRVLKLLKSLWDYVKFSKNQRNEGYTKV